MTADMLEGVSISNGNKGWLGRIRISTLRQLVLFGYRLFLLLLSVYLVQQMYLSHKVHMASFSLVNILTVTIYPRSFEE